LTTKREKSIEPKELETLPDVSLTRWDQSWQQLSLTKKCSWLCWYKTW